MKLEPCSATLTSSELEKRGLWMLTSNSLLKVIYKARDELVLKVKCQHYILLYTLWTTKQTKNPRASSRKILLTDLAINNTG